MNNQINNNPAIQHNISLRAFNSFAIEAKAHQYAEVRSEEALCQLINSPAWLESAPLILGGGSNILLTQDYPGMVVKIAMTGIEQVGENADSVYLKIGAGENWHQLVCYCVEHGLAGIENLSLIPGTVGAAPIQNIGAYGAEIKDVFEELTAIDLATAASQTFRHQDCAFAYRNSVFKSELKERYAVTSVTLRLSKKPHFQIDYGALRETLALMKVTDLSLSAVSNAVMKIRRAKLPDPKEIGNAGSFFKNPFISKQQLASLQNKYPDIPYYSYNESQVKLAAAWLIDQCGWKGKRFNQIGIHDHQALVLVNYGGGSGMEVKALAEKIQSSVWERFAVQLEPEVKVI